MVIKGVHAVLEEEIAEVDVRIEEGCVVDISEGLSDREEIEGRGQILLPALIDIGVRVHDGKLRGGTLTRLCQKAARSGFSTLALSSLCHPRIEDEITLEFAKSQAQLCRETTIVPLLSGVKAGGQLAECSILLKEGAVGIEFESGIDGNLLRRLMEYAKMHGVTLFCHANDPALQGEGTMHEGEISGRLGLAGVPPLAEFSQVARIGEFARAYGVDVVVLGVSTARTLQLCSENPCLHAQLSIHHLLLDDRRCEGYDTSGKLWPPLRDESTRRRLLEGLIEGEVRMLTSLHSPVSTAAKDAVFAEAAYGIDALGLFLPLLYTDLVEPGLMTWQDVGRLCVRAPAEYLGAEGATGWLYRGWSGGTLLFDPTESFRVEEAASPYRGRTLKGRVVRMF